MFDLNSFLSTSFGSSNPAIRPAAKAKVERPSLGAQVQSPMVSVSNLEVKIAGKTLLEDVDFQLSRGSTLAIVGPNGGGKTTLFIALMRLVPYSGTVKWGGNARIGLVPQGLIATDLPITVKEFLALKCKIDYAECMDSVGLGREILGQKLASLSG